MSASTSKLEMSLDDIIKAQKGKGNVQQGKKTGGGIGAGAKIRRGGVRLNMRRQVMVQRGGKRQLGGINKKRINPQGRRLNIITTSKKRIAGVRVVGRKPIGGNRFAGIRKNGNNPAVTSATKNLVKKLVKKAIAKNVVSSMAARRNKMVRIPANRLRQRSIMLNRISNRSRVIGRRPARIVMQNSPPVILQQQPANVRGRGPIRFATGPVMQSAAPRVITLPKRRNTIQYVQQQPAPILVQQQPQRMFNPVQRQFSVRGQINAMRRATRVQQLNTQFLKQQTRQQQQPVIKVVRQQRQQFGRGQPQVITVQQGRPVRRPRRQQQPQQVIILQQQAPPTMRRGRQQQGGGRFGGGPKQQRGGPRRQQQVIKLDPMYVPPNYLQRL